MTEKRQLSGYARSNMLMEMTQATLDTLIIGGGITGAGIALDAASRGLSVGLVEKQDFAEGTSSRSTKLIHGGLRYLKQGEIRLVREVGRERAILHRNAPHLVYAERMLLPIVRGGTYGKLATSFGLWLYDWLAGVHRQERRKMLSRDVTLQVEPLLNPSGLRGGGLYYEYRTDDARLTIEVLKTAAAYGAIAVNYAEAVEFLYADGRVKGVRVRDGQSGAHYDIYARRIVNAAGPWVDELRKWDHSLQGKRLHLTKGVHIVLPHHRLPIAQSVYFDVADGRMVFAIPRDEMTYIGTTDTNYGGDLQQPQADETDVSYLLAAANAMFPTAHLQRCDVVSSWAGLRPLIHEDGKAPSELSRKDEIFVSDSGLISIAGGKLTGYRKMAERVVDLVVRQLASEAGRPLTGCETDRIVLSGGSGGQAEKMAAAAKLSAMVEDAAARDRVIAALWKKYGSNTWLVLDHVIQAIGSGMPLAESVIVGEFRYCVEREMVVNIKDFLIRRTGRLFFERDRLEALAHPVLREAARIFQWSSEETQEHWQNWLKEYERAIEFSVPDENPVAEPSLPRASES